MQLLTVIAWFAFITNAVDSGRYQECPKDWRGVNEKCYKFVDENVDRDDASESCERRFSASLAVIDSKEENRVVQDLLPGRRYAWIGLHRRYGNFQWNEKSRLPVKYVNWRGASQRYLHKCARIRGRDGFWAPSYCSDDYPYVCWKRPDCEPGWTGDECDRQCHCYKGYACNGTDACPYGCELGWTGKRCEQRLERPTVSFYCRKEREGYSLDVSFDKKGFRFSNIGAVNAEGEISPKCDDKKFIWHYGKGLLRVQIQNTSGVLESDCPTETVSEGVLKWTFRLQRKKDVVSFEDEDLQVHCDLSEADAAYDYTSRLPIEDIQEKSPTTASQTRVKVRTYLADPDTLEPVTNVSLGVPVRLVATLPEGNDVVNPFFYPLNCQASSPDGKVAVRLTDDIGCSLRNDLGFGVMKEASGVIQSEAFPVFQLPGYTEVVFSCNRAPSFGDDSMVGRHVCQRLWFSWMRLRMDKGQERLYARSKERTLYTG